MPSILAQNSQNFSMELIVLAFVPAILVWGSIAAVRVSIVTLAALFMVATSCLPAELFSVRAGGLSWTIDRVVLIALLGAFLIGIKQRKVQVLPLETIDYIVLLFFGWLSFRTFTQPLGSLNKLQPHTLMHMINGYCVPLIVYFVVRCARLDKKDLRIAFWVSTITGMYLSFTAVCEVAKVWSLVYPKFISDPTLSIHFGRARGPMLQSVRLGVCLLASLTLVGVYSVWLNPQSKIRWIFVLSTVPALLVAIMVTYTRSIWMGLIAVSLLTVLLCLEGRMRRFFLVGGAMAGILGGLILGPHLVAFKREYSAAETRESTYMRAAFAYVSVEMIKERPIAGYGFNQFNVANLPFLSDRSTDIRLESIRGYVHHNSYLSLMVDLGIVGFTLYCLVIIGWLRESWRVWRADQMPRWARGLGFVAICVTAVHLIQMAFHEVSFSSIENGLVYVCFGAVMAVKRQFLTLDNSESPNHRHPKHL